MSSFSVLVLFSSVLLLVHGEGGFWPGWPPVCDPPIVVDGASWCQVEQPYDERKRMCCGTGRDEIFYEKPDLTNGRPQCPPYAVYGSWMQMCSSGVPGDQYVLQRHPIGVPSCRYPTMSRDHQLTCIAGYKLTEDTHLCCKE
jgi:hypothetical protein